MQAFAPTPPPAPAAPQAFDWGFMRLIIRASIDGERVEVKHGLRTFRVPVSTIRHVYVDRNLQYETIVVGTEPSPGKKKIFRFSANPGQAAVHAFVQALVALRPEGDLRALDRKTAFKTMGAKDVDLITLVVVFGLLFGILAIALLPKLIHGVDGGHHKLALSKLEKSKDLDSRNVTIPAARLAVEHTLAFTTVNKKYGVETSRSTKYYIPVGREGWDEDDEIHVILETKKITDSELAKLEDASSFEGIVRDVLWEGLGSKQHEWFTKSAKLKLANDVVLLEYGAEPGTDLVMYLGITGGTAVICGIICGVVLLRRRR